MFKSEHPSVFAREIRDNIQPIFPGLGVVGLRQLLGRRGLEIYPGAGRARRENGAVGLTDRRKVVGLNVGNNHFTCLVKLPVLAKDNYFMVTQIAKPWVKIFDKMDAYLPFEVHRFGLETGERPLEQVQGHGCLEFSPELIPS